MYNVLFFTKPRQIPLPSSSPGCMMQFYIPIHLGLRDAVAFLLLKMFRYKNSYGAI